MVSASDLRVAPRHSVIFDARCICDRVITKPLTPGHSHQNRHSLACADHGRGTDWKEGRIRRVRRAEPGDADGQRLCAAAVCHSRLESAESSPILRAPLAVLATRYPPTAAGARQRVVPEQSPCAQRSRWYAFPRMQSDEVLLFLQYDRLVDAPSDIWHCALPGVVEDEEAPPRRSMEVSRRMPCLCWHGPKILIMYLSSLHALTSSHTLTHFSRLRLLPLLSASLLRCAALWYLTSACRQAPTASRETPCRTSSGSPTRGDEEGLTVHMPGGELLPNSTVNRL